MSYRADGQYISIRRPILRTHVVGGLCDVRESWDGKRRVDGLTGLLADGLGDVAERHCERCSEEEGY